MLSVLQSIAPLGFIVDLRINETLQIPIYRVPFPRYIPDKSGLRQAESRFR